MDSWLWIILAVAVIGLSLAMMTAIRKSVGSSDKQRQGGTQTRRTLRSIGTTTATSGPR